MWLEWKETDQEFLGRLHPQLPEDSTARHQIVDFLPRAAEGPGTEGLELPRGHKVLSSGGPNPRATLPPLSAETLA